MGYKVYYRHWFHKDLRCIEVSDVNCHAEAIGHVQSSIQAGGDYKSKPFLAILQGSEE